ncbi:hypothetical protein COLO4_25316 [Corchorus olitorius]|uniref:Uncharacterized protein n=1 Tax=Corchorus olitorius TaxID=93759 RepID=A0A1R3I3I2_9ROSI|nr:hypothetical protein COLO4_25316 [Corchorus olitorius]
MAKTFNEVQKEKRARRAERKRAIHGDPSTKKLKNKSENLSVSGKRKRKLLRKWRRDVIDKGLVTMEDVEMAAAEGTSQDANKVPTKFHMKKNLKLKRLKKKGKGKSSKPATEASVDAMVE